MVLVNVSPKEADVMGKGVVPLLLFVSMAIGGMWPVWFDRLWIKDTMLEVLRTATRARGEEACEL